MDLGSRTGESIPRREDKAELRLCPSSLLTKELVLTCDASPYGVGVVLSHRFNDSQKHRIAFASRSLAPAEKNYSQTEKEGLTIIYGIKKFHMYLCGRHF